MYSISICLYTVEPLIFAMDLILLILQVMKIREIKYPQSLNFTLTVAIKFSNSHKN